MHTNAIGEKVIYFDCNSGISGDMTLGALIHLGVDVNAVKKELEKLDVAPFNLVANRMERSGVWGVNLDVIIYDTPQHDHDFDSAVPLSRTSGDGDIVCQLHPAREGDGHVHTSFGYIRGLIQKSALKPNAKRMAVSIFRAIADAEAAVHGKSPDEVEFHEVGAMDSILDIVGTAVAIDMLGVRRFVCGPIHDGQGHIECRHGIIPVPVPAVMEMLKTCDIPIIIETDVLTEMVTPTGLGILLGLKAEFRRVCAIAPEKVGYGFGKRNTGRFGAVRVVLGELHEEYEEA
jgi:uncharacterized protein (TIGR00299 family) protein